MVIIKDIKILITVSIYACLSFIVKIINVSFYTNILNPIFYSCILVYVIFNIKRHYVLYSRNRKHYVCISIILSFYIIIYLLLGRYLGFLKSPYSHTFLSIIKNIIIQVIPIITIELIRNILIIRNKNNKLAIAVITIALIFIEINYNYIISISSDKEKFFKYVFSVILPLIISNTLYTYLVINSSFLISLIIRITINLVVLLFPVLPDLDWYMASTMYMISLYSIYGVFKYTIINERDGTLKKFKKEKVDYFISIVISISIVCFMAGMLKYKPICILSNSMSPKFNRADVVIYKKVDKEQDKIKIGSIIVYTIDNQNIVHRVNNIIEKDGNIYYITKGDSNNVVDKEMVKLEQIKGVYAFHIKYAGFFSVKLYEYFNDKEAKVEIQ